jgi:hypothetical protein
MNKVKSIKELEELVNNLHKVIILSGNKREITKAFKHLECLATGACICDLCPEWDKNTYILYEFSRCIIPSKIFQLIKEMHYNTKRWAYIKPLYISLYEKVFDDILPDTPNIASIEDEQKARCYIKIVIPKMPPLLNKNK